MSVYVRRIPEVPTNVTDRELPLGRHVRHDDRSWHYAYPHRVGGTYKSVRHERRIPVLDQGEDLGSCTGNAAEGAAGTEPLWSAIPDTNKRKPKSLPSLSDADEAQAVQLYSEATRLDDYPGTYPPNDTGSDGLSVAKAMKNAGLISGYQHAFDLDTALTALMKQPVLLGINWYSSFDNPDNTAVLWIKEGAYVRGGHEIVLDQIDAELGLVAFTNSWGESWGKDGRAFMTFETLKRLLSEDGDVTIPLPLSVPAPQPTPTPQPSKPSWWDEFIKWINGLFD